jgi:hypothetical protein
MNKPFCSASDGFKPGVNSILMGFCERMGRVALIGIYSMFFLDFSRIPPLQKNLKYEVFLETHPF